MPLWPRKIPAWWWKWAKWVDQGRKGPRPPDAPRVIPPWAWARYLAHSAKDRPNPPLTKPSLFDELGGFVAQFGSFPPDTESARAFQKAGGKWLAVQFGDPTTDPGNRARFAEGLAERWRQLGVKVGCWWDVGHVGIPIPVTPPVDFRIPNPEDAAELERLPGILATCRKADPTGPLAVITLGKMPGFPTGLLETLDAHVIPECFLQFPTSDTNVENSVKFFLDSGVAAHRIHPSLLFATDMLPQPPLAISKAQAAKLGVTGFSSYVAENTPALSWSVIA